MTTQSRRTVITLATGACGAAVFALAGAPAAPLIGAALATSAAAWAGASLSLDNRLRDSAFLLIGLSLGSGFTADALKQAAEWSLSLVLLLLSILATLALSRWMLVRVWRMDRLTAALASSPGAMSYTVSIAADSGGDMTAIVVMQAMRVLIPTAALPILVVGVGGASAPAHAEIGLLPLAALALGALAISLFFKRISFPAAFFVGGMTASAIGHASGAVEGLPPAPLLFAGLCVTGSFIGSRFSGISIRAILHMLLATLSSVAAAVVVSAMFAVAANMTTGLPYGQIWIAFAPGGVEAMAAIGLALGFDPSFVAVHHLARISFLILLLPVLTRRRSGRAAADPAHPSSRRRR